MALMLAAHVLSNGAAHPEPARTLFGLLNFARLQRACRSPARWMWKEAPDLAGMRPSERCGDD